MVTSSASAPIGAFKEEAKAFSDRYLITERTLGFGAYGSIYLALEKATSRQLVCKVHDLDGKTPDDLRRILHETDLLGKLGHPNLLGFEYAYRSSHTLFTFTELATRGDLFSMVCFYEKELPLRDIKFIVQQVVKAVRYLHKNKIAHRDVKPENIFFEIGPDVYRGSSPYGLAVDMWSIGVLTLGLLMPDCVSRLSDSANQKPLDYSLHQIFSEIRSTRGALSELLQDFISRCLVTDPDQRLTAQQAKNHDWFHEQPDRDIIKKRLKENEKAWRPTHLIAPPVEELPQPGLAAANPSSKARCDQVAESGGEAVHNNMDSLTQSPSKWKEHEQSTSPTIDHPTKPTPIIDAGVVQGRSSGSRGPSSRRPPRVAGGTSSAASGANSTRPPPSSKLLTAATTRNDQQRESKQKAPKDSGGGQDEEDGPPRDLTTGRVLAENSRSCLRCAEKGLKCTLLFAGKEGDVQCAACRRAGRDRCVRQALEDLHPGADQSGWRAVIDEHHARTTTYVNGELVEARNKLNMALPPFSGADLPPEERPQRWQTLGWRDVLPLGRNRSLLSEEEDVRELLRERAELEADGEEKGREEAEGKGPVDAAAADPEDPEVLHEQLKHLQHIRKYPQREVHLNEALGETH
ncbi:hypothetical protein DL768_004015 [Monosporascus sp. mg162]|nr:hypothetical protein DL768_004015 [Monosporascus sp. mg162]